MILPRRQDEVGFVAFVFAKEKIAYEIAIALLLGLVAFSAIASVAAPTLSESGYEYALKLSQGASSSPQELVYSALFSLLSPFAGWGAKPIDYVHFFLAVPSLFAIEAAICLFVCLRLWKFSRTESTAAVILALIGSALLRTFQPSDFGNAGFVSLAALCAAMMFLVASARSRDFGFGNAGGVFLAVLAAAKFAFAAWLYPPSIIVPAGLLLGEFVEYRNKLEGVLAAPLPVLIRVFALLAPIAIGIMLAKGGQIAFSTDAALGFGGALGFAAGFALIPFLFLYWREGHENAPGFAALCLAGALGMGISPFAGLLIALPCAYGMRSLSRWNGYSPLLRGLMLLLPVAIAVFSASYGAYGAERAAAFGIVAGAAAVIVGYFYGWNDGAFARYGFVFALCAGALMLSFTFQDLAAKPINSGVQDALLAIGEKMPGVSVAAFAPASAIKLLAKSDSAFANESGYASWLSQDGESAALSKKTAIVLSTGAFERIANASGDGWTLKAYNYLQETTDSSGARLAIFYSTDSLIAQPIDSNGKLSAAPGRLISSNGQIIDFLPIGQAVMLYPGKPANATGNMLLRPGKEFGSRILWIYQNIGKFKSAYQNGSTVAIVTS